MFCNLMNFYGFLDTMRLSCTMDTVTVYKRWNKIDDDFQLSTVGLHTMHAGFITSRNLLKERPYLYL